MAAISALCRVTLAPWARCLSLTHRLTRKCPVLYSQRRLPPLLSPWVVCSTGGPCSRWWPRSEAAGEPRWHWAHGAVPEHYRTQGVSPAWHSLGHTSFKDSKPRATCQVCSTELPRAMELREALGKKMLCHKARSPLVWEQLGRHGEGEPRSSHLFHCRHKKKHKTCPRQSTPHCWGSWARVSAPSPQGKRIFLLLWSPHRFHGLIPLVEFTHTSWEMRTWLMCFDHLMESLELGGCTHFMLRAKVRDELFGILGGLTGMASDDPYTAINRHSSVLL